ncbi:MAG: phasin family protein [Woeseiaceae bacterium]|jgi:poly(hydroxyalkanoate) granule-associated protein
MPSKKRSTRKSDEAGSADIADQFEHAFLAGLGALADAQKKGAARFDALVKEGEKFRKRTETRTESLIDDVQDAIRDMAGDAQSRAGGLLEQVRERSRLDKLQSAFDARVADTMDRLNVPSKNDIDRIDRKLNKILRLLEDQGKPAAKKKASRKRATKKTAAKKKAAKRSTKKRATKKKAAKRKTSK